MAFLTPVDIGNRALQHCGSRFISTFTDLTKGAVQVKQCYDVLRRAEMRERLWKFAPRTVVLRPVTSTTQVLTFPAYAAGTTYAALRIVTDNDYSGNSATWISLVSSNTGNTPRLSPSQWAQYHGQVQCDSWSSSISYYTGEIVLYSGTLYISPTDANLNNTPNVSGWTALTGATSTTLQTPYSLTANRAGTVLNAYRLPANYLRIAPQDPKTAGTVYSAVGGGMQYTDMEFRGSYIISAAVSPLIFRFGCDVYNVADMDDMFCEALAARMAMSMVETLTQKPQLMQTMTTLYNSFIAAAGKLNAIEQGSTEEEEAGFKISRDPEDMGQPAPQGR